MMRAVVIRESLRGNELPSLPGTPLRTYAHALDEKTPVEIVELAVAEPDALQTAMRLATVLRPRLYYAHVLGAETMYICFPHCVALVRRDDPATAEQARAIGRLFHIPRSQMRFAEMFDDDHPDSAQPPREEAG
jgi:hypothetical protein